MKIVFFVLLSFLAIVGVSYIVFEIYYKMTELRNDRVCLVLFPKNEESVDLEFAVRSMVAKSKKLKLDNIICIRDNLDDYHKTQLSLLQKNYPYLKLFTKEEFIKKAGL